jgi:hypothetical protein
MRTVVRTDIAAFVLAAAAAGAADQTRIVTPADPTRTPHPNLQRFDPKAFVWHTRATDHFDIYHTHQTDLDEIARDAEQAYARVSVDLQHQLTAKVPLILLPTRSDLPRDSQDASTLVRASGAPDRDHLLLPLEPRDGRSTVLLHELSHVFQLELVPNGRIPHWASEGFADHETGKWESAEVLKIREAAGKNLIPVIESLTDSDRVWGHAVFDFIAAEYGSQALQRYLIALRDGSPPGSDISRAVFDVAAADFNSAFQVYVRTRVVER